MTDWLNSVGIDIGTTSTHLILSRLEYANQGVLNQAPRLAITRRQIIYQSQIHLTPLKPDQTIDATGVSQIVQDEYRKAGVDAGNIHSGAAIITGETARLRNAQAVVQALANLSGNLVAASAGPHLESILAARGSGAMQASRQGQRTICNIDIGGGTTNIAICRNGELLDTACLGLGGRCLQFGLQEEITALTESAEIFIDAVGLSAAIGQQMSQQDMEHLGALIAESIVQYLCCHPKPQIAERLLLTEPLTFNYNIDEFWLSGGVAELVKSPPDNQLAFRDLGAYLAVGIDASFKERSISYHIPDMPIRATVIGAGLHSLQLSGSTVTAPADHLPLKNLPLLKPFAHCPPSADLSQAVLDLLAKSLRQHDINWQTTPVSIALPPLSDTRFETLQDWAAALAAAYTKLRGSQPLVLIAAQDIALALGQLLQQYLPLKQLIVLDGIASLHGDYIDIGQPIANAQALPVIIKDLVFTC